MGTRAKGHTTSISLLLRLRHADNAEDWERFYDLYFPLVYQYACSRGCSSAMAKDVVQETLLVLARKLPDFNYDAQRGRFRSWLLTVVHSRIIDAFRREKRYVSRENPEDLLDVEQISSLSEPATQNWDEEWQRNILTLALAEVKRSVSPGTYRSFQMVAIEERSVEEACAELGINRNTLYQQRHRVLKKLKETATALAAEMGEEL